MRINYSCDPEGFWSPPKNLALAEVPQVTKSSILRSLRPWDVPTSRLRIDAAHAVPSSA
jgi:hypothetical protein